MDRAFLTYYEAELEHVRELASEFAALHPNVARNLSLESVPCPDPYVERLLEGVAYLAARTRLKVDLEGSRYVEATLDALWPDLLSAGPAVTLAVLEPGPQVQTMLEGHCVRRGTRLVAAFREGLGTRATYTTAQDVTLWPVKLDKVEYLQDRGALHAAGLQSRFAEAEAALRITIGRSGSGGKLGELGLDRLDLHLAGGARGGVLFDALHGWGSGVAVRAVPGGAWQAVQGPSMIGIADEEALLPPSRPGFGGYRLLREYFMMPERFHFLRVDGLREAVRAAGDGKIEVAILLSRSRPEIADAAVKDFRLFVTPLINLFEKECDLVELDPRRSAHVVYPDRTRPRDFEVFRLLRVEDSATQGPDAEVVPLHGMGRPSATGAVFTTERRPRRPTEDEVRRGQTRTGYLGDEVLISVAYPGGRPSRDALTSLDIRALCTNRDLPIVDDTPKLAVESGDPVGKVELLGAFRRPVPAGHGRSHLRRDGGAAHFDDIAWRLVAQLALNHLSLADASREAEPLRAVLDLYSGRGDPALARHAQSVRRVTSARVVERLGLPGPLCFGQGVEMTLSVDETFLTGSSTLLLSALLSQLFIRHAGINGFVRTRTRLTQRQEEVAWPMMLGSRAPI